MQRYPGRACPAHSRNSKETSVVTKVGGNIKETAGDGAGVKDGPQGKNGFYVVKGLRKNKNL